MNAHLPGDVAVLWARLVDQDFHARFSAIGRCYRYFLLNHRVRPAMASNRLGWYHRPLDVEAMAIAAAKLIGEHDFSAFRAAECQAKSPVKRLQSASVARHGDLLAFEFRADAFLHHMVRNIVGSLIVVGDGRRSPDWMGELLAMRDRTRAAPTFSPAGLYLAAVEYPERWRLPAANRMILPF